MRVYGTRKSGKIKNLGGLSDVALKNLNCLLVTYSGQLYM